MEGRARGRVLCLFFCLFPPSPLKVASTRPPSPVSWTVSTGMPGSDASAQSSPVSSRFRAFPCGAPRGRGPVSHEERPPLAPRTGSVSGLVPWGLINLCFNRARPAAYRPRLHVSGLYAL